MNNIQNFETFNEGIKDKIKRRWDKFKDEMHPWDFTTDEWNAKYGKEKSFGELFGNKPKRVGGELDPYQEENWGDLPRNPYTVAEFNAMIRNGEIKGCKEEEAEFVWVYKSGKVVFFKKID